MKRLLLFSIILVMAFVAQPAFVQADVHLATQEADSCNMTLLDEWEIPNDFHAGITPAPFCFIDSFIVVANEESTHVLKIDSLEHFVKLATHNLDSRQILSRDSLLYMTSSGKFSIYDFNNPYDIDSIGACTNDGYLSPLILDTIACYSHSSNIGRINISDVTNPFNAGYSNTYQPDIHYGPFFDDQYLYICGEKEYGETYDRYTRAVLEVYDPYTYSDSIAFMGRYFFGVDSIGYLSCSYFVDFVQDSFMIFGNTPNVFSIWKTSEIRNSFELVSSELDSSFSTHFMKIVGDSLMLIAGKDKIKVYDISDFPEYSLIGYYQLSEPTIFSMAVNLPYILVHYRDDTPASNLVQIKLLKYTPSDGMNCSYNAKEEKDFHIYPNPFNSSCSIELANNTQSIEITDIRGNTVKSIENPTSFNWQPQNLPSGLYFITVDFGETKITKKTVYLR